MKTLVHISDIHFGRVVPSVAESLLAALETDAPDLVVISGDLTQRARRGQYRMARDYLNRIPFPKIVVPGNHDVPLYNVARRFLRPLTRYRRYITRDMAPFYQDDEIAVLGINTARSLTFTKGRISEAQIELIRRRFCPIPDNVFKILVTHHPFLPPPENLKLPLVGRAHKALRMVEACNLDLLLAGHFHMSYAGGSHSAYRTLARSVLVIQAGTAASSRMRTEGNAYNLIHIHKARVTLRVRMWDGERFADHRTRHYTYNTDGGWDHPTPPAPGAASSEGKRSLEN